MRVRKLTRWASLLILVLLTVLLMRKAFGPSLSHDIDEEERHTTSTKPHATTVDYGGSLQDKATKISSVLIMERATEVVQESKKLLKDSKLFEQESKKFLEDSVLLNAIKDDKQSDGFPGHKVILYHNEVYGRRDFLIGEGKRPFSWDHCPRKDCLATSDHEYLKDGRVFDAVLFHVGSDEHWMPSKRSKDTIYIAFNYESPQYRFGEVDFKDYNNVFNWTMTYRHDSDLWDPYGSFVPRAIPEPPSGKNFAEGKTKQAAWMVSHCETRGEREVVGKILRQHMSVDIYGDCGTLKCSRQNLTACARMVERDYKFYFSFENSVCDDYVTEKVFRNMQYDIVPVLYGKGPHHSAIPAGAFINLLDFESLEDAANYLKYLDGNDTAYNEYFRYREDFEFRPMYLDHRANFCEICLRLHTMYPISADGSVTRASVTDETRHYYKTYPDFYDWWDRKSQCLTPKKNAQFYHWVRGMSKTAIKASGLKTEPGIEAITDRPNKDWPRDQMALGQKEIPPPPVFHPIVRKKTKKTKA